MTNKEKKRLPKYILGIVLVKTIVALALDYKFKALGKS